MRINWVLVGGLMLILAGLSLIGITFFMFVAWIVYSTDGSLIGRIFSSALAYGVAFYFGKRIMWRGIDVALERPIGH
jgi:hypothetical protein